MVGNLSRLEADMAWKLTLNRILTVLFACVVTSFEYKEWTVNRIDDSTYGAERLGSSWTSGSLPKCVWHCWINYPDMCRSIMYNRETTLCTPTSRVTTSLSEGHMPPSLAEGNLYARYNCSAQDGFELLTSGDIHACVLVSGVNMNYADAKEYCANRDAFMFSAKSMDKITLLPTDNLLYIGLTDIAIEGIFVWDYDGETITSELGAELFYSGEPNNLVGEDCVVLNYGGKQKALDAPCSWEANAVCERLLYG